MMRSGNLSNIQMDYNRSIHQLKREWLSVRSVWKDAKASEFEKTYLVPIVQKQKTIQKEMENLQKSVKRLRDLGADV